MPLDRERIIAEAVALLDAEGLEAVTTRKLATRLGVQSPTLYWHVPNKAALVTALAEAILEQEFAELLPPGPDEPWQDWLLQLAERLRRAMVAHPDGARVISASQLSLKLAAISELAISTLAARGLSLHQARITVLTVRSLTIGFVLEEQAPRPDGTALQDFDLDTFAERHPATTRAIAEYFEPGRTVDDLFRDCLRTVLEGGDRA